MGNQVKLIGNIVSDFVYSHALYGETFYNVTLCVKRDSGNVDLVPLLISDRLIDSTIKYNYVYVTGGFRSYNQHDEDKNRLKLYVFVDSMAAVEAEDNVNDVFLEGFLCKQPTYRHTPHGREIADVMLAINRQYGKSDYIPCILWGRNAYFVKDLKAGSSLRVAGRIQSREYNKNGERKTAYELSVNLVELG